MPTPHEPLSDGAQLAAREGLMRMAMHLLFTRPFSEEGRMAMVGCIEVQHHRNVRMFGWANAEHLRAKAFADVAAKPLPTGEATESDFALLEGGVA